jgi:hypothetical protein
LILVFAATGGAGWYVFMVNRSLFNLVMTAVFILLVAAIGYAFFRGVIYGGKK